MTFTLRLVSVAGESLPHNETGTCCVLSEWLFVCRRPGHFTSDRCFPRHQPPHHELTMGSLIYPILSLAPLSSPGNSGPVIRLADLAQYLMQALVKRDGGITSCRLGVHVLLRNRQLSSIMCQRRDALAFMQLADTPRDSEWFKPDYSGRNDADGPYSR